LLVFTHFVAHQSICRQEICCISIGCIGIAGENGAAEKYVCATWMHHHQLKCPNNNILCAADSLSTRTDVSQFVSQFGVGHGPPPVPYVILSASYTDQVSR
jgi:hypothetical protein